MTVDVRAVAIRFADLWAVDPYQMVDEIYRHDIVMENMANPSRSIVGADQLRAVEDQLAALIPEHRHELIRVIVGTDAACLETMVVAPLTHEYAPACVWWWLDASGTVAAEVGWFDWSQRSTDAGRAHGTVPAAERRPGRDDGWAAAMAQAYAQAWASDPLGVGLDMFAEQCIADLVGRTEARGRDAVAEARARLNDALPVPDRTLEVHRTIVAGPVLAMLVKVRTSTMATRGTVILTVDADDRILSERTYLDWTKAIPIEPPSGVHIGDPQWIAPT